MTPKPPAELTQTTGRAIGAALRDLRESRGLTARQLATHAKVSAAMISRVENGQVSPSISTLDALSGALDVPLVSLFRETAARHANITHVKKGDERKSVRIADTHRHEYTNLAFHRRHDMQFEAHLVTLERQEARPPIYVGHGVVFVHALEGEAVFEYGQQELTLCVGDSLSLDAELRYGFKSVLTDVFTFLSVQAGIRK